MFIRNLLTGLLLAVSIAVAQGAITEPVTDIALQETIPELMLGEESWEYANGDTYTGRWLNNKPHGEGVYQRLNGDLYRGGFRNGYMHGAGVYEFSNGDVYRGQWEQGLPNGEGVMLYQNGNRYQGHWQNGLRHGKGKLVYRSGSIYDGYWSRGDKSGKGLLTYRNGQRYLGDFKFNQPHGHGIKTEADGSSYRGTFSKGLRHGVGECSQEGGVIHICLFDKGREIRDPQKLELAKAYYEKHRPTYEYEGGMAYHLQDEFTKARYYVTTDNVWWEKNVALLETQLRIRSRSDDQFLQLIVNRYTGPGIYHLRRGEIMASDLQGKAIALPEDTVARLEIKMDARGEIHGEFSIPRLSAENSRRQFKIYDGRFEARSAPPQTSEPGAESRDWLVKNRDNS
ncbi:MAG: hypothetical protein SV765_11790 [Pseudomonadota bacterium]|nr:hypothetical protein [Pseudomonadota bacterium]